VRLFLSQGTGIAAMALGTCHGRFAEAVPIPGIMQEIQVLMTFHAIVIRFQGWRGLDLCSGGLGKWTGEKGD
jgi:hypothetical protein